MAVNRNCSVTDIAPKGNLRKAPMAVRAEKRAARINMRVLVLIVYSLQS